jgi:hypothetical protein
MDPATLGASSMAASAAGSLQKGFASSSADNYNAKIASTNAAIAMQDAQFAGAEGNIQVGNEEIKNKATMGTIKANQAASGIDVNSGSAAKVQESQAEIGQLNAMTIRSEAARKAYGFETQAAQFKGQESLDKSAAKNDILAGVTNTTSGLLSQGSKLNTEGAFDAWKAKTNSDALNSSALNDVGPFDSSLPWRNQPTGG